MRRAVLLALLAALVLALPAMGASGDKKKSPVHKITQSASYLMIDPIYTTIMEGDHPLGLLMIGIGLDVPDPALRAETEHLMPVLRDGYVRNLMAFSATAVRPWQQPDVAIIADRLQRVTDRTLRRKGARILLAQVAMRLTH
jgi:flagellar basal body-associated protein FliL